MLHSPQSHRCLVCVGFLQPGLNKPSRLLNSLQFIPAWFSRLARAPHSHWVNLRLACPLWMGGAHELLLFVHLLGALVSVGLSSLLSHGMKEISDSHLLVL